jgi:mutator protein MutT
VGAAVIDVSAGLVFHEGRLLITRRPETGHLAGLWEFPGGKRESDETFEECLRREILEELEIEIEPGELLAEITHGYPERRVCLRFFRCRWLGGTPRPVGCQDFRWITASELPDYAFPAADERMLEKLRLNPEWWRQP